jgi:polar amino acid transport system substrate-binding protein
MTANAMAGDKERSLEVGMDDHIAKPIDPDELFSTLLRWIRPGERKMPEHPSEPSINSAADSLPDMAGIDVKSGLRRVGGNSELYRKLLNKFIRNYGGTCQAIAEAIEKSDLDSAKRLAHTVKGTAGNIGATGLYKAAAALESALAGDEQGTAAPALARFKTSIDQVIEALRPVAEKDSDTTSETGEDHVDMAQLREPLQELQA